MKVFYISAECKPFSKAGGVGDVAGELPIALRELGIDIEIVTPWYGRATVGDHEITQQFVITFHGKRETVAVAAADLEGVPVSLVKNATYFETDYSTGSNKPPFDNPHLFKQDYSTVYVNSEVVPFYDDFLRFCFFSECCLRLIAAKKPDIVHVNDWVLGYLFGRMALKAVPARRILTIHNIGYQGNLGRTWITGWPAEQIAVDARIGPLFTDPHPSWQSVNPLRLGMELADATNTVSPTYKEEMTRPEDPGRYFAGGKGLEGTAARLDRESRLSGILNGFEYRDAPTAERFEAVLNKKAAMKHALGRDFMDPDGVLLGFVGRAVEQKFKLLTERLDGRSMLEHILDRPGVNVAIVATGLSEYERFVGSLADRPNVSATLAFDRAKAEQINLGSDVFLMPSLFEPCGITQMEALASGTPPLVRWTGGLVDTVRPHTDPKGTGFGFDGETREEVLLNMLGAVDDAVRLRREDPDAFRQLQWRGFNERFLWSTAARQYAQLYEATMAGTTLSG